MNFLIVILIIIFLAALIILGELYLRMDKNKTLAEEQAKKLYSQFDDWLRLAADIFAFNFIPEAEYDNYTLLYGGFTSINKKNALKRINTMNEIHKLVQKNINKNKDNEKVIKIAYKLNRIYKNDIVESQKLYNQYAEALNNQLAHNKYKKIAKIMKIKPFDKLNSLKVI